MITAIFTLPAGFGVELEFGAFDSGLQPAARARAVTTANRAVHGDRRGVVWFMGWCDVCACMVIGFLVEFDTA